MNPKHLVQMAFKEGVATLQRPSRLRQLGRLTSLKAWWRFRRIEARTSTAWHPVERVEGVQIRQMENYEDYVALQRMKLDYIDLSGHEERFRQALKARLETLPCLDNRGAVLCLGARLGGEVRAFLDLGCFAIGVDLNPGENNPYVLTGDFHNLQFADGSVDVVYTNSIDHTCDLSALISEMQRVVKQQGAIIIEADPGLEEGDIQPDLWQTLSWRTTDDLIGQLESLGLKLMSRQPFQYPRGGQQLVFR